MRGSLRDDGVSVRFAPMACEECRDLGTHHFRTPDDMVHAFQVASQELDRGVLKRIEQKVTPLSDAAHEAMTSVYEARAVPETARYEFECTTCGDRFELSADIDAGTGGWTRNER